MLYRGCPGRDAAIVHIKAAGHARSEIRGDGPRRIPVLGDWFAFGVSVANGHTLAAQLGTLLGPSWEMLNSGVSGYSIGQELLWSSGWSGSAPRS